MQDLRRRRTASRRLSASQQADGLANIAKSMLILDSAPSRSRTSMSGDLAREQERAAAEGLELSRHATIGRNSDFQNLTKADRERLGGMEYRSLQLLLKVVFCKSCLSLASVGVSSHVSPRILMLNKRTSSVFISSAQSA